MQIVKVLLVLILTLFWALISLLMLDQSSNYLAFALLTVFYCLLLYLVWPLGKSAPREVFRRFSIVMGICGLALSANVLLSNECPHVPAYMAFTKSGGLSISLMFICGYLGKYATFLFLFGLSCRIFYLGYKRPPLGYDKELLKKTE